jgi:hypothetical protein
MISKNELIEYKKYTNFTLGQKEKDYFQNLILFILYKEFGKELVFKGGTALNKCFGSDRFSEDLDFTTKKKDFETIIKKGLNAFLIDFELSRKNYKNSFNIILRIKGPLFQNIRQSLCKIKLDFSIREEIILKEIDKKIGYEMDNIPVFNVVCMNLEEIFAEKIRAIYTRNKARDVYDLNFLINKKVKFNEHLINMKLDYYNIIFDLEDFKEEILKKEKIWKREMNSLVANLEDFKEIYNNIIGYINPK